MERADLISVLRKTGCAEEHGDVIFLCDPKWSTKARVSVDALIKRETDRQPVRLSETGWLCVPTGGTTGGVRFARHDERTLSAAVRGFCEFFNLDRVNAVDVLPSHHVSGLMARVRCAATGGRHVPGEWRRVEAGELPSLDHEVGPWVVSLVPTQLQRLLASAAATSWLREFHIIFVGGGPIWPEMTHAAAAAGLRVALTYGMTETAAMVAAVRPEDFLAGERGGALSLPHASLSITEAGSISVEGPSVFYGYYPESRATRCFETGDLGRIDERGRLHVLGRRDAVIITGGKKVQPVEVEAALQATGQFADVAVLGVADVEWGEVVVACFPKVRTAPDFDLVERGLEKSLASYQRPKRYVPIGDWPRNALGKLNREILAKRLALTD